MKFSLVKYYLSSCLWLVFYFTLGLFRELTTEEMFIMSILAIISSILYSIKEE